MEEGSLCLKWRIANRAKKVPMGFPQILEKSVEIVLLALGATPQIVLAKMNAPRVPLAHSLLVAGRALSAFRAHMKTTKAALCAKGVQQAP